jgi:hypothetical protein
MKRNKEKMWEEVELECNEGKPTVKMHGGELGVARRIQNRDKIEGGGKKILSNAQPWRFTLTHQWSGALQLCGCRVGEAALKRYWRRCAWTLICLQIPKDVPARCVQPECLRPTQR